MILFFIVCLTNNIDQDKIDKALAMIEQYQVESVIQLYPQPDRSLNHILNGYHPNSNRADIIVGDVPAETLVISGSFYNYGNIIVINDGVLIISNADFSLDGNIIVVNRGQATASLSTMNFIQHYIYQRGITIADSAKFSISDCQTTFSGYPIGVWVGGTGEITLNNVDNQDWITAVVGQSGKATLNNVGITGEWLFGDRCFATFNNVHNFLSWFIFPDLSVANIAFPAGDTVNGFVMDSALANVDGIDYHVEIDSSINCMWAAIPLKGSNVTVNNSELRVTGIMFEGHDTFTVSGLVNGLHYDDYVLPVSDRIYRLINSSVQTWNLYPDDTVSVTLASSIFGELCAYGNSNVTIMNAYCDGSGGHLEAASNAVLIVGFSSVSADIITKNRGMCIVAYCAMPWGNIWATSASILILINTQFPEDPIPSDTSIVFVEAITGPSNAATDDTVGIMGSAWIDPGPYHPVDFGFYRLSYRIAGDTSWIPFGDSNTVEVRRDLLEYWNTVGLVPGIYEVRLVMKDNVGDSVECSKQITLRVTGIEELADMDAEDNFRIRRLGPRRFIIENINCPTTSGIYDLSGREIFRSTKARFKWEAMTAGVFFVKNSKGSRKIVAY